MGFLGNFGNRQAISVANFVERLLRGSRAIDAEAVTSAWVNYNDLSATEPWKSWLVRENIPRLPSGKRLHGNVQ